MIATRRIVPWVLVASLSALASCNSQKNIGPDQLVKTMYTGEGKTLSFDVSNTKSGEHGTANIVDEDNVDISLSYTKGTAYKGDSPPHSANEISTGVSGAYSYCVSGINRKLTGSKELATLEIPVIQHLIVSIMHPDASTSDSYKEHLSESSSLLQNIFQLQGGAALGKGYDGADETYYLHGGWLWRWEFNDNFAMLCAYPVID